jgi:hypothetical protein
MAASSLATSCRYLGSSQPLNESNTGQRILCNLVFSTDFLEGTHLIVLRGQQMLCPKGNLRGSAFRPGVMTS